MVNITYAFKTQTAAATAYAMMKTYLNSKGWEGNWVDMSSPFGITQRSPDHKEILVGGQMRRAPYIQMGGINTRDEYKYQVSIRALTHLSEEDRNEVVDTFDRTIKSCMDMVVRHLDKNDENIKMMYIWLELHKHQHRIDNRDYRDLDETAHTQGTSFIVFDGYKSVKLYSE